MMSGTVSLVTQLLGRLPQSIGLLFLLCLEKGLEQNQVIVIVIVGLVQFVGLPFVERRKAGHHVGLSFVQLLKE